MPLMRSKSKQAFEHNMEAEMHSGKPKDQALAIAYSVKRKAKKPKMMAEGGSVSAANEKRPMPEAKANDSVSISHNSGNKAPKDDSWSSRVTVSQAQKPSMTKLSQPRMVESGIIRPKLRDQEHDLMSAMPPQQPTEEPSKAYDEEEAMKMGSNPDMAKPHSARKAYFEGGAVSQKASEEDMVEHPEGLESDDDMMSPAHDEYMAARFAEGGMAHEMDDQPMDEEEEEHHASIADAIMAKRKMMAEGGMAREADDTVGKREGLFTFPKSSTVDLDENAMEEPNDFYALNEHAALKENYDEAMDSMHQPMDSNEHGDSREDDSENKMDMISAIRSKMRSKRR